MFLSALKSGIRRAGRKEAGDVIAKLEKGIDQVFGDPEEGVRNHIFDKLFPLV